jgi:hypothetical protein
MAGRHNKRPGAHAQIPEQRRHCTLGITDAQNHLERLVTEQFLAPHRHSGRFPAVLTVAATENGLPQDRYTALCGADVVPAALVAREARYCRLCASLPTQRSRARR